MGPVASKLHVFAGLRACRSHLQSCRRGLSPRTTMTLPARGTRSFCKPLPFPLSSASPASRKFVSCSYVALCPIACQTSRFRLTIPPSISFWCSGQHAPRPLGLRHRHGRPWIRAGILEGWVFACGARHSDGTMHARAALMSRSLACTQARAFTGRSPRPTSALCSWASLGCAA